MNIGKRLKEGRKEKGISLEEIASETKIRKKYLKALEQNDFDQISGQVYVKAFIRGYGDVVDIDTEPLIEEYQEYIKEQKEAEKLEEEKEKENESVFKDNYIKIIISLILIVSLALATYYIFLADNSTDNTSTVSSQKIVSNEGDEKLASQNAENDELAENNSSTSDNDVNNEIIENNNSSENMSSLENELNGDNNTNDETDVTDIENPSAKEQVNESNINNEEIEVVANERSWIQIRSDEEIIFQGFLNSDNRKNIDLNEYSKVNLKIGNGVGIYILHNNNKIGPWGESGEVIKKEIVFEDELKIK